MSTFPCPYLNGEVELTEERELHIAERHPDLMPIHRGKVAETLHDPDQIRLSTRFANARLFAKWYSDLRDGKHVVVVVITQVDLIPRHWIITAYVARKLSEGVIEWTRS